MSNVDLSVPQSRALLSDKKSVGVVAGFGSGKTFTALIKAFDLLYKYPGVPVGYAAPTYGLIEDIWYPAVEKHCAEHDIRYSIQKSKHIINVEGLGNIVCRSLSNPDKIVGFEVGDFLLDEMDILQTQVALTAWRKCKARCRFKFPKKRLVKPNGKKTKKKKSKRNQMFAYTTPEGFKATYQLFKKKPLPNSELIQMSTYTNLHNLPDDYIEELMANYPPQLIAAYIDGQFTNLTSGTVYPGFDRFANNAPKAFPVRGEALHIGMDFNVQNMSAIIHVERMGIPFAVGELTGILDTGEMIKAIQNAYPKHPVTVYPDASGDNRSTINASTSDLKMLKKAGFKIKAKKKNPSVRNRINSMNGMFCNMKGERRYYVNTEKCPVYTENLEQQAYDKNGNPDKKSNNDHTNDGAGYYIETRFGISKPDSQSKRLTM